MPRAAHPAQKDQGGSTPVMGGTLKMVALPEAESETVAGPGVGGGEKRLNRGGCSAFTQ